MKVFKSYSDPQHSWVAVKREFLKELGIYDKITPFSYQKGATVYLEEDVDVGHFVVAFEAKFKTKPAIVEKSHSNISPIRSYEGFKQ